MDAGQTILALVESCAEGGHGATALVSPGRQDLSYRRLLEEIQVIGSALRGLGIGPDDRVAVVIPNTPESIVAIVGVMSWAACAPLNPALTAKEFEFELEDFDAKLVLATAETRVGISSAAEKLGVPIVELTPMPDAEAGVFELSCETEGGTFERVHPDQTSLVLHTSGTTARPKIVPLTHSMLVASARNVVESLELQPRDRYLSIMPNYHIHGLATMLGPLASGSTIVCPDGFEVNQFLSLLSSCRPTWYSAAPTFHQGILNEIARSGGSPGDSSLRFVRSASAALPVATIEALERALSVPVIEFYGMTEATDQICSNPLPPGKRKPGSVGLPTGVKVCVMGDEKEMLSAGETGEFVLQSPTVISAYENNPKANRESFHDGWFRTGDLGYQDADGYAFITGRAKEVINRGGEKISPREVDEVLMRHPAVHQAVAFALPHPTLGEAVAAAIVLSEGHSVDESALRSFARDDLAEFKVPQRIVFVNDLPKGATGKLQRIGLADKLVSLLGRAEYKAPTTTTERLLCSAIEALLKLDNVGLRDNYFELGGDSMSALAVIDEIRQQGYDLQQEQFAVSASIGELAASMTELDVDTLQSPITPLVEHMSKKLSDFSVQIPFSQEFFEESVKIGDTLYDFNHLRPSEGDERQRILEQLLGAHNGVVIVPPFHCDRGKNIFFKGGGFVNSGTQILDIAPVHLGSNIMIASNVVISSVGHPLNLSERIPALTGNPITIGDDVWIGAGSIILDGVTIGDRSVIGVGSVVATDIPPDSLAIGTPCRVIQKIEHGARPSQAGGKR